MRRMNHKRHNEVKDVTKALREQHDTLFKAIAQAEPGAGKDVLSLAFHSVGASLNALHLYVMTE